MLGVGDVVTLLAERGLLDLSEVMSGELRIVEASRRNRNLHVLRRREPSYMLKQGLGGDRRHTVAHEAAVYEYLAALDGDGLARLLPGVVGYLAAECVLLLEFVKGAESLEAYHARSGRYAIAHARRLAEALYEVHRATATAHAKENYDQRFPTSRPWTLSLLHRPDTVTAFGNSNGNTLAVRMIQGTAGFLDMLDAAAQAWTPHCLVHGDLRFDNCLVPAARDSRVEDPLTIVDWELSHWGDPCWDAGAVLGSYLGSWLLACPISGETPLEAVIELGRHRLTDMQRAAGAFWATYDQRMARSNAPIPLRRTMQFAAVHLLQTMSEELQASSELTGRAVCLAQLAFNVLERPDAAAEHFLAIPVAA